MESLVVVIGLIVVVIKKLMEISAANAKAQKPKTAAQWAGHLGSTDIGKMFKPAAPVISATLKAVDPLQAPEGIDPCHDKSAFAPADGHVDYSFTPVDYDAEESVPQAGGVPVFTKDSLLQAVIMAEVLERPIQRSGRRAR